MSNTSTDVSREKGASGELNVPHRPGLTICGRTCPDDTFSGLICGVPAPVFRARAKGYLSRISRCSGVRSASAIECPRGRPRFVDADRAWLHSPMIARGRCNARDSNGRMRIIERRDSGKRVLAHEALVDVRRGHGCRALCHTWFVGPSRAARPAPPGRESTAHGHWGRKLRSDCINTTRAFCLTSHPRSFGTRSRQ